MLLLCRPRGWPRGGIRQQARRDEVDEDLVKQPSPGQLRGEVGGLFGDVLRARHCVSLLEGALDAVGDGTTVLIRRMVSEQEE